MVRLSYSKIQDFVQCPRKYWLSYVKGIPLKQNEFLIAGKEIHEILHQSTMHDDWQDYILQHPRYKDYQKALDNYIVFQTKVVKNGGNPVPEFAEIKLYDNEYDFSLVIDRIDEFQGKRMLMDYKTDRLPEEGKHDKQLLLYTYFFNKQNPDKQITHIAPFFVKARKTADAKPVDPVKMEETLNWMKEKKTDIESRGVESNKFECKPDQHCIFCSHRLSGMCPQGVKYVNDACGQGKSEEMTDEEMKK